MKTLIAGSGLSGKSAFDYLEKIGTEVEFVPNEILNYFDKEKDFEKADRLFDGLSFLVKSPGITFDNELIKYAVKKKVKIISELELGLAASKGDKIGVTGTNGKTTTVTLINFLLKDSGRNIFLGGTIGTPVTRFCDKTKDGDITIVEASSFQLERNRNSHFHIAAILNITPDHLNHHRSMKDYIKSKQNITKKQTENDYLLLNADSEILMQNVPKTKAKIFYFSTEKQVEGCYIKRGSIYFNDNLSEKKLVSLKGVRLVGKHNLQNILCACLAVYLELKRVDLLKDISNFGGVPHRIEYVKTINGISFFNDSKATNIDSTKVAISSFSCGINLILGGSDKGYEFDEIFAKIPKNVRNIAIFGQTKQKIAISAKKFGYKNVVICSCLKDCVCKLYQLAKPGEIVLLSPACASFDCFSNFEERGVVFKKIVEEISIYENAQVCCEQKT